MLKKTISKIMAVTMLVSSIGQISLLNTVSAAEQASTKDVWIDFENYNSVADVPTDSSGDFYLQTTGTAAAEVATIDNSGTIKDKNLMIRSIIVLSLVILGFTSFMESRALVV